MRKSWRRPDCSPWETSPDALWESLGSFTVRDLLYRMFGINAELLIDHAWGWEPCTIADIKAYRPEEKSVGAGQVLQYAYDFQKTRNVVQGDG